MSSGVDYPLAVSTWDEKEVHAIQNVIQSNIFTMGKYVEQFEKDFAVYLNSNFCIMVNSGSSANLLMIAALMYRKNNPLKPGDEIIVPAVSWPTTYYPISQYGLILRFVDVDLKTLNYDLEALENAVTPKTRAIMTVNLLGNPNDFKRITQIADKNNLIILEDNCESLGASFHSKQAGTFGLMGSFSCFFSHHISTMEGGMISTDDEEIYHILLSLRAHGWTRNIPKFNHVCGEKSNDNFEEAYRFILPGYNVRPIEMSGAIGIEQLKKLPKFIETRRSNAKLFHELFFDHPKFMIQREIGNSSWFAFSLIIKQESHRNRNDVVSILSKARIETRPIVAGNFTRNEVLKWLPHSIYGELKNAEYLHHNGLYIGNHHYDLSSSIKKLRELLC